MTNKDKLFSNNSFVRKGMRIMLIIPAVLLVCVFILVGVLLLWQSRKTRSLRG